MELKHMKTVFPPTARPSDTNESINTIGKHENLFRLFLFTHDMARTYAFYTERCLDSCLLCLR